MRKEETAVVSPSRHVRENHIVFTHGLHSATARFTTTSALIGRLSAASTVTITTTVIVRVWPAGEAAVEAELAEEEEEQAMALEWVLGQNRGD